MAAKRGRAAAPAAAPSIPSEAPHWQVAYLAEPGQVFTETDIRGVETTVRADARGVVIPRSFAENALVDRLPLAPAELLAAPAPSEPTEDAGGDAAQED